ncbi:hypothetical protein EK21DRAFT_40044, partial [Setomelanomma holmii]
WGDPELPKANVIVEGQEVPTLPNLHAALRRLRAHESGRSIALFADALCINQLSVIERNHQIQLMGRTYSQSSEVFVCLG